MIITNCIQSGLISLSLLATFALCSLTLHGQSSIPDTVFVKRSLADDKFEVDTLLIQGGLTQPQVLAGTTFLPSSDKLVQLLNHGLSPIELKILDECDENLGPESFKDYPKFRSVARENDKLIIEVSVIANCCHNFLGEAHVLGNDTLNLVYNSYGSFCSCSCCFTLQYSFNTSFEELYEVLKYVTINESEVSAEIPDRD